MANCITITTVTVLEITEKVFQSVLENSPPVAYAIMRSVLEMLRNNDKLAIADLVGKNQQLQEAYQELQEAQEELVEMERLERELEIAAEVQRTLLPDNLPLLPDYRFAAFLKPARRVGGDFYDAIELDGEHVGLLLADVADKSVQAALFMAVSRTLFMVESRRFREPSSVALAVHRGVLEVAPTADIFVTAFYGVLHRPSRRLTYVSAGHEQPLLIRPGAGIQKLEGKGRFLGMIEMLELDEFYGVPDATNGSGEQFGYDRLTSFLYRYERSPVEELVESLAADIAEWRGEAAAFDDLTLLALEVVGDHGKISAAN
jgi:serine phosphatase RsbU (regulator of sigma subunit)